MLGKAEVNQGWYCLCAGRVKCSGIGGRKIMAGILKHFLASPPLFQKALFKSSRVFKVFFLRFQTQFYKISTLLTGETLKTSLIMYVALENSRGERAKCF